MVKHTPLSPMRMTAQYQIHRGGDEREIFWVMRHDHPKTWLSSESGKPPCLWFMIPGMNRAADAADTFLAWVAVGTAGFGSIGAVVCDKA